MRSSSADITVISVMGSDSPERVMASSKGDVRASCLTNTGSMEWRKADSTQQAMPLFHRAMFAASISHDHSLASLGSLRGAGAAPNSGASLSCSPAVRSMPPARL